MEQSTSGLTQAVRISWKNGKPAVYIGGEEVTNSIAAGGMKVEFPDSASDEFNVDPKVTLTFHADLELEVDAEVVTK